ncbi:MAG: NAD(P)/FAD-dependent oxidoreductase [Candidatus Cloacimonadales bacterium]|nr:NAD(P)/FAD-dependent oxidoreductase [Candidatus Cloacimonadales bacterium]
MNYHVLIIGGGAAGMMAAGMAAKNGKKTILIEKNPVLGKKLLITGKGRCNLTNYCEIPELIENIPTNGKFLINAFYQFNSYDTISFFSDLGLEIKIERGNRVFPTSDKAADVVHALIKFIHQNKVEVLHTAVESVQKFGNLFAAKLIDGEVVRAEKLIIATGGKSYQGTGSTGDGYKFARTFGHKVTRFKPSLVPIEAMEFEPSNSRVRIPALQGLSLKNISIKILDKTGQEVYAEFGEMLFTHFGISGPIILSASSHLHSIDDHILCIDLKPALDEEALDLRLQRDFSEHSQQQFQNVLKNLLPAKMIPVFIILSNIPAEKKTGQLNREERKTVLHLLKNLKIKLDKFRPIQEAIITSGGVDVKEIDPRTMESKLVPNLYFAGEVIDVDAYTGGFNLQIAWSTGFVAGKG